MTANSSSPVTVFHARISFTTYVLGYDEKEGEILTRLQDPAAKGEPGFITDIFGIRTRTANLWPAMQPFDGSLWGSANSGKLALGSARGGSASCVASLTRKIAIGLAVELGAGWGPAVASGGSSRQVEGN